MKKYSFILILYLICVFTWTILQENISLSTIGFGFLIITVVLLFSGNLISDSDLPEIELPYFIKLFKYYFKVLVFLYINSLLMIKTLLQKNTKIDIVTIDLPTDINLLNAFICNSISLNPSTISLDMKEKEVDIMVLSTSDKKASDCKQEIEDSIKILL